MFCILNETNAAWKNQLICQILLIVEQAIKVSLIQSSKIETMKTLLYSITVSVYCASDLGIYPVFSLSLSTEYNTRTDSLIWAVIAFNFFIYWLRFEKPLNLLRIK